jgi:DNA repair ATPase RecN
MVRSGTAEAVVEGRFALEGGEVVAKRKVTADGRSRCTIDGSMATVGELARILGPVVDLHGQHEHQSLLTPSRHAGYLDRYIGERAEAAGARYREERESFLGATAELDRLTDRLADARRRADYLRFVLQEIEAVDPQPGEDDELERRLPALTHAEKLTASAHEAADRLRGREAPRTPSARRSTPCSASRGSTPRSTLSSVASAAWLPNSRMREPRSGRMPRPSNTIQPRSMRSSPDSRRFPGSRRSTVLRSISCSR